MRATTGAAEHAEPPRSPAERKDDLREQWRTETTAWVATSGSTGPHLVPLLFTYDGAAFTFATFASSVTVANIARTARVRIAIGHPYDVAMIDGTMRIIEPGAVDPETAARYAALLRGGPDPRQTPGFVYLELTPLRVQAWRSFAELGERTLMRGARWPLVGLSQR
ncbi:MAG TPA: pyridoxamine 5'-phosphate oxidase family protein [Candidatus Ruania gallistercoris]|uniref:Pyridoxamine 5'-phosphate oxidase family protein n=1 Tax=Candidatus Ruania gallistercoris TaxID=2838746 RepID=A0A9D2J5H5_9MICO|nr:pyridoxamine 5'-phosphate oxidase family protein [Candidatus Ruania gallistercoris]